MTTINMHKVHLYNEFDRFKIPTSDMMPVPDIMPKKNGKVSITEELKAFKGEMTVDDSNGHPFLIAPYTDGENLNPEDQAQQADIRKYINSLFGINDEGVHFVKDYTTHIRFSNGLEIPYNYIIANPKQAKIDYGEMKRIKDIPGVQSVHLYTFFKESFLEITLENGKSISMNRDLSKISKIEGFNFNAENLGITSADRKTLHALIKQISKKMNGIEATDQYITSMMSAYKKEQVRDRFDAIEGGFYFTNGVTPIRIESESTQDKIVHSLSDDSSNILGKVTVDLHSGTITYTPEKSKKEILIPDTMTIDEIKSNIRNRVWN